MRKLLLLVPILLTELFPLQAGQQPRVANSETLAEDSENAACEILKARIAELYLSTRRPDRYWFCDFTTTENEYVRIVGLRSSAPRADGATIYSNLLGWYAVARRSRVVLEYDVGEDRLIPERSGRQSDSPVVEDSQRAACDVLKSRLALTVNGRPDPSLACEFSPKANEYLYLVELRPVSTTSQRAADSKAVGKFAVAKRSNVVLRFDENGNRLVPLGP